MNRTEILSFINKNPICSVATSNNNIPSVRIMRIIRADESGILFNTKRFKDSYRELTENPCVELCFYNPAEDIQIRVWGEVVPVEELTIREKIVEEFPKLNRIVEEHGIDVIVPFLLKKWEFKMCGRH